MERTSTWAWWSIDESKEWIGGGCVDCQGEFEYGGSIEAIARGGTAGRLRSTAA